MLASECPKILDWEFFRIDWGFFVGLLVNILEEAGCESVFFCKSMGTGLIITFDLLYVFDFFREPVIINFELLITSGGLSGEWSILFLIVLSKFFMLCSFKISSCYFCFFFFYSSCFFALSFIFLFFSWDFFAWKELLRESQIELKEEFILSLMETFFLMAPLASAFFYSLFSSI